MCSSDLVLTLKRRVPTNCVAADKHSARIEGVFHDRLIDGLLSSSWISAALVKNQEPMKHSRLVAPAPPTVANPGAVAIANKDEPIANNQHWRRSIFSPDVATLLLLKEFSTLYRLQILRDYRFRPLNIGPCDVKLEGSM